MDFNWGPARPPPASARTAGARAGRAAGGRGGGLHTFFVRSDGGARLWIDDKLVVDDWTDHPARVSQGTITLQGGHRYAVKLEYHDPAGAASLRLLWSAPGIPRQVVPVTQLFP